MNASRYGHTEITRMLLQSGALVNTVSKVQVAKGKRGVRRSKREGAQGKNCWVLSVRVGFIPIPTLTACLFFKHGSTALLYAASSGRIEIPRMLIDGKANVNAKGMVNVVYRMTWVIGREVVLGFDWRVR